MTGQVIKFVWILRGPRFHFVTRFSLEEPRNIGKKLINFEVVFCQAVLGCGDLLIAVVIYHSLDTVMKTRFIFGTRCVVAMLAAEDRKLVLVSNW